MIYGIDPPNLPDHCDGCGTAFDICLALDFNKVGLVTAHHNYLYGGVSDLARNAFTPTYMHDNPKIYAVCSVQGWKYKLKCSPSKDEV